MTLSLLAMFGEESSLKTVLVKSFGSGKAGSVKAGGLYSATLTVRGGSKRNEMSSSATFTPP